MVIVHSDEDGRVGVVSVLLTHFKDPNAMVHIAQRWHAPPRQRLHYTAPLQEETERFATSHELFGRWPVPMREWSRTTH